MLPFLTENLVNCTPLVFPVNEGNDSATLILDKKQAQARVNYNFI